jgi:hypothetical protein
VLADTRVMNQLNPQEGAVSSIEAFAMSSTVLKDK